MHPNAKPRTEIALVLATAISLAIYLALFALSGRFAFESPFQQRPIVLMLALFTLAGAVYLVSVCLVRRAIAVELGNSNRLLAIILVGGFLFRLVLLGSTPIQEIDIYRYLWDGAVVTSGVSPFRYSPQQALHATKDSQDPDLQKLASLREAQPGLKAALRRVHFAEVPTVYPPVSQAVFAAAAWATPAEASLTTRVVILKSVLVLFDLATMGVVVLLLRAAGVSPLLVIVYAWCPLLIKEIANSGHLDAVAIFFTTLAVYLLVLATRPSRQAGSGRLFLLAEASALMLAGGVGAKIYPVVLAPLFCWCLITQRGWLRAMPPSLLFLAATAVLLSPMAPSLSSESRNNDTPPIAKADAPPGFEEFPTTPQIVPDETKLDPSAGLVTFLRYWEINDFLFLICVENLKPVDPHGGPTPWFVVIPQAMRLQMAECGAAAFATTTRESPFLISRAITSIAFLVIALMLAYKAGRRHSPTELCRMAFLTLAWFWLLSPTQNPWYWLWTLPLLAFTNNRAWLWMGVIVFTYYLRFWFDYHFPSQTVLATPYAGVSFFDFVVTWIEFAPWFCMLIWCACPQRKKS